MNNSEQIKYVYGRLEALKYFNSELRYKLPDFQSENKK